MRKRGTRRKSMQVVRWLLEAVPAPILLVSADGTVVYANLAVARRLERRRSELVGSALADLAQEEGLTGLLAAGFEGEAGPLRLHLRSWSGKPVTLDVQLRVLDLPSGPVAALVGTEPSSTLAERAVRLTEARYRIVADNTRDWEFWLSSQGHFLYSSPSCQDLSGYEPREFEDDPDLLLRCIHPEDREAWLEHVGEERAGRGPLETRFRLVRRDGQVRWVHHVCQPIFDEDGHPLGLRGSHRDVTERQAADSELRRLAAAVEHAADGVMITDPEAIIQYVNPAFERISGFTQEDLRGRSALWLGNHGGFGQDLFRELMPTLSRGTVWTGRISNRRPDGVAYDVDAVISPVRDEAGAVVSYAYVFRDITQQAALEAQLRQAQKMEAIGTLAGGVAHDFNNLLTGILGQTSLLRTMPTTAEVGEAAEVIDAAARRAAELTGQLLRFARGTRPQVVPVNLHTVISEVVHLLSRTFDRKIELRTDLQADHPFVLGDAVQLQQVLMNLAINARDALEKEGTITLSTGMAPAPPGLKWGRAVVVSVSDDGAGIPPELQRRIFEPFFSTKAPGKGTGMGLALVYSIVKSHGGLLELDSEPGRGSTFRLSFPASRAARPAPVAVEPPTCGTAGSGRILLVDDEEVVRRVGERLLRRLGYDVEVAADGVDALERFRRDPGAFDLVILDLAMPRMGGGECFAEMRALAPQARILLSTGFDGDGTADELMGHGALGVVPKPYQLAQISRAVACAISGRPVSTDQDAASI